jgi:hypothetical protein
MIAPAARTQRPGERGLTPAEFAAFLAFAVWLVIVSVLTWLRSGSAEAAADPDQASSAVLVR